MIVNPHRVSHRMVGRKYISLIVVDGEYELSVFSVKGQNPDNWPQISVESFTDARIAQEAYEWKARMLADKYSF